MPPEHVRKIIRDHGDMSSKKFRCALLLSFWSALRSVVLSVILSVHPYS
jgi:hypothetical protein